MRRLLAFAAILLLTFAAYWSGLRGPLIFDDVSNLQPLVEWLDGSRGWGSVVFGNHSGLLGRPVSMASFVINIAALGPAIWKMKLFNLLLHLANGVLVYALLRGFMGRHGAVKELNDKAAYWLPWLGASLWLLHPLLVSTVLYVVQRMAMLAAGFIMLALLAYLHGRMALEHGNRRKAWALIGLAVPACTIFAVLSKENGMLALPLCAVLELCLFSPQPGEKRSKLSRAVIAVGLVLPLCLGVMLTVAHLPVIVDGYANRPFTLMERVLTQPRVLWDYVGALVLPYGPRLGLYHDDYSISRGLLDPPATLFAILAWLAVLAAAWRLRKPVPGFALGLGIFLIGHALESSVFPLLMYFEHRNYLPMVGALWALLCLGAYMAQRLQRHMHHAGPIFRVATVGLIAVLALATAARSGVWASEATMQAQSLETHPESRWLRMDLISRLMREPADPEGARIHADAMRAFPQAETRRIGAVERLMIDCGQNKVAEPALVKEAFAGNLPVLEADMLLAYEQLSDGVLAKPCGDLGPVQLGNALDGLLDRSSLAPNETNIRRLRFKAAQLYGQANDSTLSLEQAYLAYQGERSDAPVAVFIADRLIAMGHFREAERYIASAEHEVAPDDVTGRRLLEGLRAAISQREGKPDPNPESIKREPR